MQKKYVIAAMLFFITCLPVNVLAGEKLEDSPPPPPSINENPQEVENQASVSEINRYMQQQPGDLSVVPEKTTVIDLSNSDVNRITCDGQIDDLIFSSEKGVDGHYVGENAFIKFKITKRGSEKIYSTIPTELFVSCQGKIYSLIANPKHIPAVTLRLSAGKEASIKKNKELFDAMPFEKKIIALVKQAYKSNYPDSYLVRNTNQGIEVNPQLNVVLDKVVDVEGEGLRVKELSVTARQPLELDEKMFLNRNVGENVIAIAIDDHVLKDGKATRVFVVESKEAKF